MVLLGVGEVAITLELSVSGGQVFHIEETAFIKAKLEIRYIGHLQSCAAFSINGVLDTVVVARRD